MTASAGWTIMARVTMTRRQASSSAPTPCKVTWPGPTPISMWGPTRKPIPIRRDRWMRLPPGWRVSATAGGAEGGWGNWGSGSGTSHLPPSSCGDTVQSGCLLGRLAAQTDWQGQVQVSVHIGLSNGGGLFCYAASSGVAVSVGFGGFATLSMSRTGSGCFSSGNGDVMTTTTTTVQGSSVTPVDTCFSMQCISEGAQGAADKPTDGEEELGALMDGEGDGGGGGKEPSIGDNSGDSSTTTAYRVQGGGSKERITVTPEGNIQIKGKDMLYVNFGNYDRALEFLGKRSEDAYIVQFEVSNELVDVIRSEAKLQYRGVGREFPANPQLVDPKYPGQYGLPQEYFDLLIEFTIPGSAKLITF